jgi:hypothetical protein
VFLQRFGVEEGENAVEDDQDPDAVPRMQAVPWPMRGSEEIRSLQPMI